MVCLLTRNKGVDMVDRYAFDVNYDPRCDEEEPPAYDGEESCRQCKHSRMSQAHECHRCLLIADNGPIMYRNFEPIFDPLGLWEVDE